MGREPIPRHEMLQHMAAVLGGDAVFMQERQQFVDLETLSRRG